MYKKIILIIAAVLIIAGICVAIFTGENSKNNTRNNTEGVAKLNVTSSNFASYDFLRAIIGDNTDVKLNFLLGPGKDAHSYEPTAQDIITIQNSDLFVYIGGEMEQWADKVLDSLDNTNVKVMCIADFVETIEEKDVDGAEEEEEHEHGDHHEDGDEHEEEGDEHEHIEGSFDEHIWTSPTNAIKMVNALEQIMEEMDSANTDKYKNNATNYIEQIQDVDKQIQNIVDNKVRNRLIFGDKMPMQYFMEYYKLNVSAAFNGCSTETDPSASTIAYLIGKAKEEQIPVILYIELNPGRVAKIIADEVGNGCKAMQIQALHNVSLDDFNKGETWVSLMTRNIEVLKKALQ